MIRTQIQLPDEIYRAAKELAARKEWSLAEVVRRGVESILLSYPEQFSSSKEWQLPESRPLGGDSFFGNPDWRYEINQARGMVQESKARYKSAKKRQS